MLHKNKIEYTSNGGYAEVIAHSVCGTTGKEIKTVNVKYGLIVHAEFLRHRLLSRGVKSNRAVSTKVIRKEVLKDPYIPVWFGANQKGMVADNPVKWKNFCVSLWKGARYPAVAVHWVLDKVGLHKEVCNRLLNPWQWVRETITATEWDNFYNLRNHKDAQKDITEISKAIYKVFKDSTPEKLSKGEWHVPYVTTIRDENGKRLYIDNDGKGLTTNQALKCSAARCARSSYDTHDGKKATYLGTFGNKPDSELYQDLVDSTPVHASPVEHQATPMTDTPTGEVFNSFGKYLVETKGVTHLDKNAKFWSGNFQGFIQHRQMLEGHTCWEYKEGVTQ